jgi:cytoskeletal protein CcmA (bactofilin family)
MMARRRSLVGRLGGVILLGVLAVPPLAAQQLGETIVQRGEVGGDTYLAGRSVELVGAVDGDATVAGQRVAIGGDVAQDVIAAGERVSVSARVGDDVRVAGRHVRLTGSVADHVVGAGESVVLGTDAQVGSFAWLAGREVEVLGRVGGELRAAGQTVSVGGAVMGDARIFAERIRVLAGAHIAGDLTYASPNEPQIEEGARIDGSLIQEPVPDFERERAGGPMGWILFVLSLALAAIAFYLLLPRFTGAASRRLSATPGKSLAVGLAVLIGPPILFVLLMASVIGWLVGLMLIASYLVWLAAGLLTGVRFVADAGLTMLGRAQAPARGVLILALAVAAVVVVAVQLVPVVGPLAALALFLLGLGALSLAAAQARTAAAPAA